MRDHGVHQVASRWRAAVGTNPNVFADAVGTPWWAAERIWSSPGVLEADADPASTFCCLISVEGAVRMHAGESSFVLDEHKFVVLESAAPLSAASEGASARMEMRFTSSRLGAEQFKKLLGQPLEVSEAHWQLAVAMLTTLISAPPPPGSGTLSLRGVLEHLVISLLSEARDQRLLAHGGAGSDLLVRAMRMIDANFDRPDFSVAMLASMMAVSPTHLHRVFAPMELSPRRAIEQTRVRAATDLLAHPDPAAPIDLNVVAKTSGFSSVRQMRNALDRWA